MLPAVVGLWTGGAAVRTLALGRGADWLDLAVGVLGTLYVAAAAALSRTGSGGAGPPRASEATARSAPPGGPCAVAPHDSTTVTGIGVTNPVAPIPLPACDNADLDSI